MYKVLHESSADSTALVMGIVSFSGCLSSHPRTLPFSVASRLIGVGRVPISITFSFTKVDLDLWTLTKISVPGKEENQ